MTVLRGGYTTGSCAAAAAKAAVAALCGFPAAESVEISLPDETRVEFSVASAVCKGEVAEAAVRKDAGDDPDVTHQSCVLAAVQFIADEAIVFVAGEGVGIVTKPGLSIPPGEPAINPTPREMIRTAIREITDRGVQVTISIPGGRELAERTFNPRLGIVGGLSILGTTGRVRPFSVPALCHALKGALDVAAACDVTAPVLVPGNIGESAARRHFRLTPEQIVQVSTEWGYMMDEAMKRSFERLLVVGHPGKLAKLAAGQWDTHSSRSSSAVPVIIDIAKTALALALPSSVTVEGAFAGLQSGPRKELADAVAAAIGRSIAQRYSGRIPVSVVLVNMAGDILGSDGDLKPWR